MVSRKNYNFDKIFNSTTNFSINKIIFIYLTYKAEAIAKPSPTPIVPNDPASNRCFGKEFIKNVRPMSYKDVIIF